MAPETLPWTYELDRSSPLNGQHSSHDHSQNRSHDHKRAWSSTTDSLSPNQLQDGGGVQQPRRTQRAPQSCIECSRRKIKCDKTQPCKACMKRGEGERCRREAVLVKGAVVGGEVYSVAAGAIGAGKAGDGQREEERESPRQRRRTGTGDDGTSLWMEPGDVTLIGLQQQISELRDRLSSLEQRGTSTLEAQGTASRRNGAHVADPVIERQVSSERGPDEVRFGPMSPARQEQNVRGLDSRHIEGGIFSRAPSPRHHEQRNGIDNRESGRRDAQLGARAEGPGVVGLDQGRLPGAMEEAALGIGESTRWLGSALLSEAHGPHGLAPPPKNVHHHQSNTSPSGTTQEMNRATTDPDTDTSINRWFTPQTFDSSLARLPSGLQCRALVLYYLEEVNWHSGAIQEDVFMGEYEAFWDRAERVDIEDNLWLGLLFAVLSISAMFMDESHQVSMDVSISSGHLRQMAFDWFNTAVATAMRCNALVEPSLLACQIVQVLSPGFHLTQNTRLHVSLSALAKSHAHSINLHLLGESKATTTVLTLDGQEGESAAQSRGDEEYGRSTESVRERRKELGRRIWWNTVEVDWAFLPYNRYFSYSPHQFTTGMPRSASQPGPRFLAASGSKPLQLPSMIYRDACYRSSRILFDVYHSLGPHDEPSYDDVLEASRKMQIIMQDYESIPERPTSRSPDGDVLHSHSHTLTPRVVQSRLTRMTLAYRLYQIHRLFYAKSFEDGGSNEYAPSQAACLTAANIIVQLAENGLPPIYYLLWNVTVMLVAAGIVLAIAQLHNAPDQPRVSLPGNKARIEVVQDLMVRLRGLNDQSGIASRGAALLQHLLNVNQQLRAGQKRDLSMTREAILEIVKGQNDPSTGPTQSQIPLSMDGVRAEGLAVSMDGVVQRDNASSFVGIDTPGQANYDLFWTETIPLGEDLDFTSLWDEMINMQ